MKNFFTPNVSDYLTPLPQDSSSPFPTESNHLPYIPEHQQPS